MQHLICIQLYSYLLAFRLLTSGEWTHEDVIPTYVGRVYLEAYSGGIYIPDDHNNSSLYGFRFYKQFV